MKKTTQIRLLQNLQALFCPVGPFADQYYRFKDAFQELKKFEAFVDSMLDKKSPNFSLKAYQTVSSSEVSLVFNNFSIKLSRDLTFLSISKKTPQKYIATLEVVNGKPRICADTRVIVFGEKGGWVDNTKYLPSKTDQNCLGVFWLIHTFGVEYQFEFDPPLYGIYLRGKEAARKQGLIKN